jgi:predicted aminopeptidase
MRRWLRWMGMGVAGLALVSVVLLVATPLGRYLARAGWEEARILAKRRDIAGLVERGALDAATRAKLQLVLEARAYAVDSLGLPAGEAFTTFSQLDRDTLVLVLSGAARDALTPVLWNFPVVGRLPYKGYFGLAAATAARDELTARGFDTYLRPAAAFSTLGWFNDPLLSTTLRADSVDLVNTVIHELTHNRYFAKGDATFNESFANFVGARGAQRFFLARGDTARAVRAALRWADDRALAAFWGTLYRSLDSLFAAHPGEDRRTQRIALRDSVYGAARHMLVDSLAPAWRTIAPAYAERVPLDNAALLARRTYLTDLEAFEEELNAANGDLRRAIDLLIIRHNSTRGSR